MAGNGQNLPVGRQELPVERQDKAVTVSEAARLLGKSTDAVRSALRRGTIEGYRDNSGEWRIPGLVAAGPSVDRQPPSSTVELDFLRQELRQASDRQATVAELEVKLARMEGEAVVMRERVAALEAHLERERANHLEAATRATNAEGKSTAYLESLQDLATRLDVAHAELALSRRSWWRRMFG
jgi:hypothetical protein